MLLPNAKNIHDHFYHNDRLFFEIKNPISVNFSADLSEKSFLNSVLNSHGIAKFSVVARLQYIGSCITLF